MNKFNHQLHRLNHILATKWLWQLFAFVAIITYLAPLIIHGKDINMLVFDNLDSNIVWYKILAESGMIFAPNDMIIPNMMSGLPRLSYGSEFDVILWFYYFFSPITAYTINIVLMHTMAFFAMYLFANRYLISKSTRDRDVLVYFISIIFALLPFWPSGGMTITALPLVSYAFLNIYFKKDKLADWLILLLIPFYSSFVLLYIYYIAFASILFVAVSLYKKKINWKFLAALVLFFIIYLLVSYRLVQATFFNNGFISHRIEFNLFFTEPFLEATRRFYLFFLNGHQTHLRGLQMPFLLPTVLFSALLLLFKRRLTANESWVIFFIFALSLWLGIWEDMLGSIYSIPVIILSITLYMFITKKIDIFLGSIILYIIISAIYGYIFYSGLSFISDLFPIFKSLSLARAAFIQPLLFAIVIALALQILFKKMHFQFIFLTLLLAAQLYASLYSNWHRTDDIKEFSSFENYYALKQFKELKNDFKDKDLKKLRFISYGLEPAISLYNGIYTVDGYSTNYPLEYKHRFNQINDIDYNDIFRTHVENPSQKWGSKLYIMSIRSAPQDYQKDLSINFLNFNEYVLEELKVEYLLSAYWLNYPEKRNLKFIKKYEGNSYGWDIYLYKFENK